MYSLQQKLTMALVSSSIISLGGGGGYNYAADTLQVQLADVIVKPEYVEVERMIDTKQVIVIKKEDIEEKGYTTLSDVLRDVPSINVGLTGSGDIDIRGQGSDQSQRNIQVMLDGAPITTLVNHPLSTNYDVVPVEDIERIEIIPGGGSVVYGSGASGGVINITTNLRSMKKTKNTVGFEWNTNGTRTNINLANKVNDKMTVTAGYSKLDRDLYFKNTYRNSDYVFGGFRYDWDKDQSLTVRASHLEEESNYIGNIQIRKLLAEGKNYDPGYTNVTVGIDENGKKITEKRRNYLNGDRELNSYNMTYENKLGNDWKFIGDFFYNEGYYRNINTDDKKMNHDTKGTKMKFDYTYGQHSNLLIGIDYMEQTANLNYNNYKSLGGGKYGIEPLFFNYAKKTKALYALNTMNVDKWGFSQGLRREQTTWGFNKQAASGLSGADDDNRWNTAAELSAAYHYNDMGRVYARWERGYTSPDGLQITDEVRDADNNKRYVKTSAKDEIFNMYEIGWQDEIGASTISVTGFYSETNNQMNRFYIYDVNNHLNMLTMNILRTKRHGVDVSLKQKAGKWTFSEGYTYLKGYSEYNGAGEAWAEANPDKRIDYTKSGLMKVPKHKAVLRAEYAFNPKFTMGATYTYIGGYNNFYKEAEKNDADSIIGSHTLVDLDFHYKVNKDFEFYGGVTNLFNKEFYEYESGVTAYTTVTHGDDRTYFGGVKYTF